MKQRKLKGQGSAIHLACTNYLWMTLILAFLAGMSNLAYQSLVSVIWAGLRNSWLSYGRYVTILVSHTGWPG